MVHIPRTKPTTLNDDLSSYLTIGRKVQEDFTSTPLLAFNNDYTLTDTLKDGIEITYGKRGSSSDVGPSGQSSDVERSDDPSITKNDEGRVYILMSEASVSQAAARYKVIGTMRVWGTGTMR